MERSARHLRNVLAALVSAVCVVLLAAAVLPAALGPAPGAEPGAAEVRAHRRVTLDLPPRLVPVAGPAEAYAAAPAPPPTTTTSTTAPPTPSTTASTTPPTTSDPRPRSERIRALVDFPFEQAAPEWQVQFARPRSDGLLGLADQQLQVIHVYVHPDATDAQLAFTLAHEMAHALDTRNLDADERLEYRRLRGLPAGLTWSWAWDGSSTGDFVMPAGDFAESFAVATTGGDTGPWASRLGAPPGPAVQQRVVEMAGAA